MSPCFFFLLTATIKLVTGEQGSCFVVRRYWVPVCPATGHAEIKLLSKQIMGEWGMNVHDHCRYPKPHPPISHSKQPSHHTLYQTSSQMCITLVKLYRSLCLPSEFLPTTSPPDPTVSIYTAVHPIPLSPVSHNIKIIPPRLKFTL
jgi:hypothetical protein